MDYQQERAVLEAAQRGDHAAFEQLVRAHQKRAFSVAFGILRDREEASDVCQEAFLRVLRSLDRFERDSRFYTWLYRIVVNLCLDVCRSRRPHLPLDEVANFELVSPVDDPAHAVSANERRAQLDAALAQLSPNHRTVLVLRELQGLSYKEIAASMRCSIGTVMSRLFHARRRLLEVLTEAPELPEMALAA
jgi:RNA polymerase sigma-70 factor (ECF subfamily)